MTRSANIAENIFAIDKSIAVVVNVEPSTGTPIDTGVAVVDLCVAVVVDVVAYTPLVFLITV